MTTQILTLSGSSPYAEVHRLQRALLQARIEGTLPNVILFVEHEAVFTLGRAREAKAHVHRTEGVPLYAVERGGDVTWHGPGQLVAYPIVALEGKRQDLHRHMHDLEQAVIDLLTHHDLSPTRDDRNTGVWLPTGMTEGPRKVCSIGIACRKWVTWHGLALNLNPSLEGFQNIDPCGLKTAEITRLADHIQPLPSLEKWIEPLAEALLQTMALEAPTHETFLDVQACASSLGLTLPPSGPPAG
jgi:lipoyl(octanoyl) transferase